MKNNIWCFFGIRKRALSTIGWLAFALPALWDIFKMGAQGLIERGFIVIHIPGLICMTVGAAIIGMAYQGEQELDKYTKPRR